MVEVRNVSPQQGYQMKALSSSADIVIGGGAAGSGKTFCLLLDPLRYISNPEFGAVVFRRTTPQITSQGGLWDESSKIYPFVGATSNLTHLNWSFPSGAKIKFSHIEHEKNVTSWQGSQIPYIGFDELTHFSKETFFYLLSRNRSTCGVQPCVRATCNPDPDSWVFELIKWWIDDEGYPIPERQGELRYFVKDGDNFIWSSTLSGCIDKASYFIQPLSEKANIEPKHFVKSITFIGGSVYENEELLKVNPDYLANLAAQSEENRKQLLDGNWKVSINPEDIYEYKSFQDLFNNSFIKLGDKRITVDVAMMGKDKLIINFFEGFCWTDINIIDKSSGKDVIDAIKEMQLLYGVPNSKVVYDANGVGAFIGGNKNAFIPNSVAFDNASKAIQSKDKRRFKNLKAQCYYYSGARCNKAGYYISPKVANTMYDDKMTVRQRLLFERKAIKKVKRIDEEPEGLIKKDTMKQKYLSGSSPDLLDSFMMNEIFEIKKSSGWSSSV